MTAQPLPFWGCQLAQRPRERKKKDECLNHFSDSELHCRDWEKDAGMQGTEQVEGEPLPEPLSNPASMH